MLCYGSHLGFPSEKLKRLDNRTSLCLSSPNTQARGNNIITCSYNKFKHSTYFKADQRGTTLGEINYYSECISIKLQIKFELILV
jgi:hypothetical protein